VCCGQFYFRPGASLSWRPGESDTPPHHLLCSESDMLPVTRWSIAPRWSVAPSPRRGRPETEMARAISRLHAAYGVADDVRPGPPFLIEDGESHRDHGGGGLSVKRPYDPNPNPNHAFIGTPKKPPRGAGGTPPPPRPSIPQNFPIAFVAAKCCVVGNVLRVFELIQQSTFSRKRPPLERPPAGEPLRRLPAARRPGDAETTPLPLRR